MKFLMARAKFETATTTPNQSHTTSSLVRGLEAQARAKFAAHPELLAKPEHPTNVQQVIDFNARHDKAMTACERLLAEARRQLAAPCTAPEDLTVEEKAELEREAEWDRMYARSNTVVDAQSDRNERLFDEVMRLIDAYEAEGIPTPDEVEVPVAPPSPSLSGLNVPKDVMAWIADSKQHAPPPSPKPSPAVESLKKILAADAAERAKKSSCEGKRKAKKRPMDGDRDAFIWAIDHTFATL